MSVKINRIILNGNKSNSSLAVFMYVGNINPKIILDEAIKQYVGENEYYEFVDDNMDNPWTRVIIKDIYESFEPEEIIIANRKFNIYNLHNDDHVKVKYIVYVEGIDERPNPIMDIAKIEICKNEGYNSYIDSEISDLWSRLIIFGVNEMTQEVFKDQKI